MAVEGAGRFWLWSRGLRGRLNDAVHHFRPQVIHTHGCWMAAQLFALQIARKLGIPTIASFHNFLDPQVRPEPLNKLKKAAYWSLMGRRVFEHADVHHAITTKEVAHIREYLPRARVIVIPHLLQDLPASAQIAKEMAAPRNKIVFLGRIARVKGIEQLIDGFALSGLAGDFELMIAGPIQDNELYQLLLKKAQELSVAKHVSFIGPVAGVPAEFTSDSVRSKWTETYLRLHEQSLTRPNRQAQTDHPACAQ
jgi:glycosyltransferase involved in cell wall biosynthesis